MQHKTQTPLDVQAASPMMVIKRSIHYMDRRGEAVGRFPPSNHPHCFLPQSLRHSSCLMSHNLVPISSMRAMFNLKGYWED